MTHTRLVHYHQHPDWAADAPASSGISRWEPVEAMSRALSWSPMFALTGNDRLMQRSSGKSKGANSMRTPPLVVVRTSGTAAEA